MKKWVYKELVTDKDDVQGIIAYSIYKANKDQLATSLRADGKNEDEITVQLNTFHDHTLLNNGIDEYREKANSFLVFLYSQVHSDLEKKHKREIKNLESDLISKVKEYQKYKKPLYSTLFSWLISGIPSIISAFIISVIVFGVFTYTTSDIDKKDVLKSLAESYLDLEKPSPPK